MALNPSQMRLLGYGLIFLGVVIALYIIIKLAKKRARYKSPSIVSPDMTVYELIEKHPEVRQLLIDMGVKGVENDIVLRAFGKRTTIEQLAKALNLSVDDLIRKIEDSIE